MGSALEFITLKDETKSVEDNIAMLLADMMANSIPDQASMKTLVPESQNTDTHFQSNVLRCNGRVILMESGSVLDAYRRAAEHPRWANKRLVICLQSFESSEHEDTGLFQSHLADDGKLFREIDRSFKLESEPENRDGMEILKLWGTGIIRCTPDRVFSLWDNKFSALAAWPVLSQAAFVFDAIHGYDETLFQALLTFLEKIPGADIMLSAVDPPPSRRKAIESALKKTNEKLDCVR